MGARSRMAAQNPKVLNWKSLTGTQSKTQKSMCNKKVEKQTVADLNDYSLSRFIWSACLNRKLDNSN
jgi:hypothetical protein